MEPRVLGSESDSLHTKPKVLYTGLYMTLTLKTGFHGYKLLE